MPRAAVRVLHAGLPDDDRRRPGGARQSAELTEEEVDDMVGGNLCRCTGYANIKKAVHHAGASDRCGTTAG